MTKRGLLITNFFLIVLLFSPCCYASDDDDFQYWNNESIEGKLSKNWKIKVDEEFRFSDDAGSFYYNHTDIGSFCSLNENLEIGLNYRHIYQKKNKGWDPEYRPHVNVTLKTKLHNFAIKDRSRFEYRMPESASDSWRYRNKLSVDMPFKWKRFNIGPYIADEIFVDFDKKELNRNRLYLGFKMKFFKNLQGEIFYLWQSTRGSKWKDYNVLGTGLKLAF